MAAPEWSEWSDAEIRSRLIRRGVDPGEAKILTRDREMEDAAAEITEVLEREYLDEKGEVIRHEVPIERRSRR